MRSGAYNVADAAKRRNGLILAQGSLCAICGKAITENDRDSENMRPSLDHVIPRDMAGGNLLNLVVAHNQCNRMKANDLPTGCEVIWLLAVNARLRQLPAAMINAFYR